MAYREFRNESTYKAPETEMSFTKQALQNSHEASMHDHTFKDLADRKDRQNKHALDMLKAVNGADPSPFGYQNEHLKNRSTALTNKILSQGGNVNYDDIAEGNRIQILAKQSKGQEERWKSLKQDGDATASKDPTFNQKAFDEDMSRVHVEPSGKNSWEHPDRVMTDVEQQKQKGKYHDAGKIIQLFHEDQLKNTQKQEHNSSVENNFTTTKSNYSVSSPYMFTDPKKVVGENVVVENGKEVKTPVYDMRPARTVDEMIKTGAVDKMLYKNPNGHGEILINKYADHLDPATVEAASEKVARSTGIPVNDIIRQKVSKGLIEEMAAKDLLSMQKIDETVSKTISKENPPKKSEGDKEDSWRVNDLKESGKFYVSKTRNKDGSYKEIDHETYGAVDFRNDKGKAPVIKFGATRGVNAENGESETVLGGTDVTVDKAQPGIVRKDGTVVHVPKGQTIHEYIQEQSPATMKKEGWQIEPVATLTTKINEAGVSDTGLGTQELKRFDDLKEKKDAGLLNYDEKDLEGLKKKLRDGKFIGTDAKENAAKYNSIIKKKRETEELYKLDQAYSAKKKTFRVPYSQVSGQVKSVTKMKGIDSENLFDRTSFSEGVNKAKHALNDKLSSKASSNKDYSKMSIPNGYDEIVKVDGKHYFVTKDRKKHQLID